MNQNETKQNSWSYHVKILRGISKSQTGKYTSGGDDCPVVLLLVFDLIVLWLKCESEY